VDEYRTDDEQLDALRRWWGENGKSLTVAVVTAVALSFGWQTWQASEEQNLRQASDIYQALLRNISSGAPEDESRKYADELINEYSETTYAQFAAFHLAAIAVQMDKLPEAERQLRWVLKHAAKGSDSAQLAELRLARVLSASGQTDKSLAILQSGEGGNFQASYAAAEGDVLLAAGRNDEARLAYQKAMALGGMEGSASSSVSRKLQSLMPAALMNDVPVAAETTDETENLSGQEE